MSKRFYYDEFCEEIFDEEIQTYPSNQSICGILNKQAERIAELEEQLKNAIVPKFNVGQTVYTFNKNTECVYELCIKIIRIEINEISKFNSLVYLAERLEDGNFFGYFEVELFATKEEAQAKLKELGESDVKD
jgi:hypothetical protein